MDDFNPISQGIRELIFQWEPKLSLLDSAVISERRNNQNRTIKQITGHMVDSATNNIHRVVHLQYQPNPLIYPDYANLGMNDKWIAIQDYQHEDWNSLVQLWKYLNLHYSYIILIMDNSKLEYEWITATNKHVTLKDMVIDYLRHLKLHLNEIEELMNM